MSKQIWRKGPPPHAGWWLSRVAAFDWDVFEGWRWIEGDFISNMCTENLTAEEAGLRAQIDSLYSHEEIEWCEDYPENARVPRIDPRATS